MIRITQLQRLREGGAGKTAAVDLATVDPPFDPHRFEAHPGLCGLDRNPSQRGREVSTTAVDGMEASAYVPPACPTRTGTDRRLLSGVARTEGRRKTCAVTPQSRYARTAGGVHIAYQDRTDLDGIFSSIQIG
jgi:hypothetical protein